MLGVGWSPFSSAAASGRPIFRRAVRKSASADSSRCRASHRSIIQSVGEVLVAKKLMYLQRNKGSGVGTRSFKIDALAFD